MKRLTAIIAALALTIGLTACGGEKGGTQSQEPSKESQTGSNLDKEAQAFLDIITIDNAQFKGICGANAMWYYKDNVLVIKGTGAVDNYSFVTEESRDQGMDINWVVVDEGITGMVLDEERPSQILCKPPMWCRIEAPHRRFYI